MKRINAYLQQNTILLLFACWVIFHEFLSSADFFKLNIFEKILSEMPSKLSNMLDPDQARHFVGPDQGPTCL